MTLRKKAFGIPLEKGENNQYIIITGKFNHLSGLQFKNTLNSEKPERLKYC